MHANLRLNRESGLSHSDGFVRRESSKGYSLTGGANLSYCEYGDPQGLCVVFFHDFASSRLEAGLYAKSALEAGLRIIAVDRPGVGHSDLALNSAQSFSLALDQLLRHLSINQYSLLSSGLGLFYALEHANHNPEKVFGITALCADRSSVLSMYCAIPSLVRPCAQLIIKAFISIRAKRFAKDPDQYIDRYSEDLCFSDKRMLLKPTVRQNLIGNLLESTQQGADGALQDLRLCAAIAGKSYSNISARVDFWSGASDARGQTSLLSLGLNNAVQHTMPKCGEYFYLNHMPLIFAQLKRLACKQHTAEPGVPGVMPVKSTQFKRAPKAYVAKSISA